MRWMSLALVVMLGLVGCCEERAAATRSAVGGPAGLVCYAGPNMRVSIQELARRYQERTGVRVRVESDDVRPLIDKMAVQHAADLFVTHDPFLNGLSARGVEVKEAWTAATVTPMIAVAKGNPKNIRGLEDLGRPGMRVGLTDEEQAISGQITKVMLRRAGVTRQVEANVVKRSMVGRPLGDAVAAGELDAAIVWNVVIFERRDRVDAVDIRPEWRPKRGVDALVESPSMGRIELDYARVNIALLADSKCPREAKAFAQFVASSEGAGVFLHNGFTPADPKRPAILEW